jgi:hypothetical protein
MALDRIQLEVWWNSGGNRRTFPVEAFRRRPVTAEEYQAVGQ